MLNHVVTYIEVSTDKDKTMNYENDLELCEYNPVSLAYQEELRVLAKMVEAPAMSFFQKLMKKIVVAHSANV